MVKRARGFTLVELLVVISIIGILAALVIVGVTAARQKSRDARRLADIKTLKTALESYANKNSVYPQPVGPCTWANGSTALASGVSGTDDLGYPVSCLATPLKDYLGTMVADPSTTQSYQYVRSASKSNYGIYATFERKTFNGTTSSGETNVTYCKTGSGINPAWWGDGDNAKAPAGQPKYAPTCNF